MSAAPQSHHGAFGSDTFGRVSERTARFFGTPQYIIGQTIVVIIWIAANTTALLNIVHFDKYPYILLNLAFSTQAAYAAPLILLAQTRQSDRDKIASETAEKRHSQVEGQIEGEAKRLLDLLQSNTQLTTQDKQLTEQIAELTREIHALICKPGEAAPA